MKITLKRINQMRRKGKLKKVKFARLWNQLTIFIVTIQ